MGIWLFPSLPPPPSLSLSLLLSLPQWSSAGSGDESAVHRLCFPPTHLGEVHSFMTANTSLRTNPSLFLNLFLHPSISIAVLHMALGTVSLTS
jgi:hypothetical protein